MHVPYIGEIVLYKLSADDAEDINRRRKDARDNWGRIRDEKSGYQAHVGQTTEEAGNIFPMIVTLAWHNGMANGQVILDGNDSLWVTSVSEGDDPGEWQPITNG